MKTSQPHVVDGSQDRTIDNIAKGDDMKNPLKGRRNPILDIMVTILIIVVVVMGLAFWALVLSYHLPWWVAAFVTICAFGMARMLWQTLKE